MNENRNIYLIFATITLALILLLTQRAYADIHQFYFFPAEAIQSEQVMVFVLTRIQEDFKTKCPGEAEMQVTVLKTGVAIEMFCIAEEVNNESNNLSQMPEISWMSKTKPSSENNCISYL